MDHREFCSQCDRSQSDSWWTFQCCTEQLILWQNDLHYGVYSPKREQYYLFYRRNMRRALKQILANKCDDLLIVYLEDELWLQSPSMTEYYNPFTLRNKLLTIIEQSNRFRSLAEEETVPPF